MGLGAMLWSSPDSKRTVMHSIIDIVISIGKKGIYSVPHFTTFHGSFTIACLETSGQNATAEGNAERARRRPVTGKPSHTLKFHKKIQLHIQLLVSDNFDRASEFAKQTKS